jgi:hypothetical protein
MAGMALTRRILASKRRSLADPHQLTKKDDHAARQRHPRSADRDSHRNDYGTEGMDVSGFWWSVSLQRLAILYTVEQPQQPVENC